MQTFTHPHHTTKKSLLAITAIENYLLPRMKKPRNEKNANWKIPNQFTQTSHNKNSHLFEFIEMYTIFKTIQYPLLCIVCKQAEKPFSLKFIRSSAFTLSFFLDAFQFPNQVTQITRTHRKKRAFKMTQYRLRRLYFSLLDGIPLPFYQASFFIFALLLRRVLWPWQK